MNYIIGCGGVGSWLAPAMVRLVGSKEVILIDGDKLERKNLDRQLFNEKQIGENKASALARLYGCQHLPKFFAAGDIEFAANDWLLVCADNDVARKEALVESDASGPNVIIAANEAHSAEAYFYTPPWRGRKTDPRVYYPHILTDTSNNPMAAAIGCTGAAQVVTPQLVTANMMAASLLSWLYVVWAISYPKLDRDVVEKLPHRLVSNMTKLETFKIEDTMK